MHPRGSGERGASLSALVAGSLVALLLVIGLVVDGGARVRAQREASVTAASVARAGADASVASRLVGEDGTEAGLRVARERLTASGLSGSVGWEDGQVVVRVQHHAETTFLPLLGIDRLDVSAESRASSESER